MLSKRSQKYSQAGAFSNLVQGFESERECLTDLTGIKSSSNNISYFKHVLAVSSLTSRLVANV
jgi:hypothetical protein